MWPKHVINSKFYLGKLKKICKQILLHRWEPIVKLERQNEFARQDLLVTRNEINPLYVLNLLGNVFLTIQNIHNKEN